LSAAFGRDEAVRALKESHQEAFRSWLRLSLSDKSEDLRGYLAALEEPPEQVVDHWLQSGVYRSYVPAAAMEVETDLFCRDLETLLQLLKNEAVRRQPRSAGDAPGRGSSQLA
jgi:hypothetical protein